MAPNNGYFLRGEIFVLSARIVAVCGHVLLFSIAVAHLNWEGIAEQARGSPKTRLLEECAV